MNEDYIKKTLYLKKDDVDRWEAFCKHYFKTKRVLSKIVSESMEEYIENFEK